MAKQGSGWKKESRRHSLARKGIKTSQSIEITPIHDVRKFSFTIKVMPTDIMGEYIALHGLVPQNELPQHMRDAIPENEIWIREDVFNDPNRKKEIINHEKEELRLMIFKELPYKQAHLLVESKEGKNGMEGRK